MTTIIYGVYASGGEYEDAFHNLIKVWTKKTDAEEQIFELNEIRNRRKIALELKYNHSCAWDEANPNTIVGPERCAYPKWTGIKNQDITQAMRDERNAIIGKYNTEFQVYTDAADHRRNARDESCAVHLAMKGLSNELIEFVMEKYFHYGEDIEYVIEEVELD